MTNIYKVQPTSRLKIREFANRIRRLFAIENDYDIPIVEVFEFLSSQGLFSFEILDVDEMGNKCGETFPSERHINIREDVYDKACIGDPFSRTTLAHEFFHLFHHSEEVISLCRTDSEVEKLKAYEDPEWQANCFAGELLVPKELVKDMNVEEVVEKCRVSVTMANYQMNQYKKEDKYAV